MSEPKGLEAFTRYVHGRLVSARDSYRHFLESKRPVDRAHQLLRERCGALRGLARHPRGTESRVISEDPPRSGAGKVVAVLGVIWILRRLNRRKKGRG